MKFNYDKLNTFSSNKSFNIMELKPDDITLEDIAHSLSLQCRFNGHIARHYSVARHSINVRSLARNSGERLNLQRVALLHDATEAYLTDLPTPIKDVLPEYRALESFVWDKVCRRFDLNPDDLFFIKKYDKLMFNLEVANLFEEDTYHFDKGINISFASDFKDDEEEFLIIAEILDLK